MDKKTYFDLRNKLYGVVGELGTLAETSKVKNESDNLSAAYNNGSYMLDYIDGLGYSLGYLNPETNEELN